MATKNNNNTRDAKGRKLKNGERQRPDGRYEFRYQDSDGETRSIYSWKLVPTDSVPAGKKNCLSLREMESGVFKGRIDGLNNGLKSKWTLNQYFEEYLAGKKKIADSTRAGYVDNYNRYVRDAIGNVRVTEISEQRIKKLYKHLLDKVCLKPNSLQNVHTILHPIFTRAVRDHVITVNPTEGAMTEIKEDYDMQRPHKRALTEEEQNIFVDFVSHSKQYYRWMPLFTVMLGTGCRIGEIIGLRWCDLNFDSNTISINHQVIYRQKVGGGGCRFRYSAPKTDKGIRNIPMLKDVREAFKLEEKNQSVYGFNTMEVDGFSGFIFRNRFGDCLSPHCINRVLERIVNTYNSIEQQAAPKDNRTPILLPRITCHIFRHTFSTRMFDNGVSVKTMQEILGHADYQTTMDIYTDLMEKKMRADLEAVDGKIRIS